MREAGKLLVAVALLGLGGCEGARDAADTGEAGVSAASTDSTLEAAGGLEAAEPELAPSQPDPSSGDPDAITPVANPALESAAAEFSDTQTLPPLRAITDLNRDAQLVLNESRLYLRLSERATQARQGELMERGLGEELKNAILETVVETARAEAEQAAEQLREKRRRLSIVYPLEQVLDVRYDGERLIIDVEREKRLSFDDVRTRDGRPVLGNFHPHDAQRFVLAYRELRR